MFSHEIETTMQISIKMVSKNNHLNPLLCYPIETLDSASTQIIYDYMYYLGRQLTLIQVWGDDTTFHVSLHGLCQLCQSSLKVKMNECN